MHRFNQRYEETQGTTLFMVYGGDSGVELGKEYVVFFVFKRNASSQGFYM